MMRLWAIAAVMTMAACTDPEPLPEAPILPCLEWRAQTQPADDVGEVLIEVAPFYGIDCYTAADGESTWCAYPRTWQGHLGTYGRTTDQISECTWLYAIDSRTPATGEP